MKYFNVLLIICTLILCGCTTATDSSNNNSDLQNSVQTNGLIFKLTIPKTSYKLMDSLKFELEVKNVSMFKTDFSFPNQQQYGYKLVNQFNSVALYYPFAVQPACSGFSLYPGESKTFTYSGAFKDPNGDYVKRGMYYLSTYLLGEYPEVTLSINVN